MLFLLFAVLAYGFAEDTEGMKGGEAQLRNKNNNNNNDNNNDNNDNDNIHSSKHKNDETNTSNDNNNNNKGRLGSGRPERLAMSAWTRCRTCARCLLLLLIE